MLEHKKDLREAITKDPATIFHAINLLTDEGNEIVLAMHSLGGVVSSAKLH